MDNTISKLRKEIAALEQKLKSLGPKKRTMLKKFGQGIKSAMGQDVKLFEAKSSPQRQKIIDEIMNKKAELDKILDKMPQPKKGDSDFP